MGSSGRRGVVWLSRWIPPKTTQARVWSLHDAWWTCLSGSVFVRWLASRTEVAALGVRVIHREDEETILDAAAVDVGLAALEFDGARAWLEQARRHPMEPLAADVWVSDPGFGHILLVKHRVRGSVPPGGKVEPGETPRAAAARELVEEAGLHVELLEVPAAVCVRSYRSDWSPTLGLS